jgi:hypothetical protein
MLWFALQFSDAGSVAMNLAIGEAPPVFAANVALVAPAVTWFIMFFTPLRHLYSFFPIKVQLHTTLPPSSSPLRHVPCCWGPDIACAYLQVLFILGQAICWQRCVVSACVSWAA